MKRLSAAPPAEPTAAAVAPNPPLVCPKALALPPVCDAPAPKTLPNPPPGALAVAVEEKLNPAAEPNAEVAGALSADGAAKENPAAEGAEEEAATGAPPNPVGGCVGAAMALPNPVEAAGVAVGAPNPPLGAAKLKLLACAGADDPKPPLPKLDAEDPKAPAVVDAKPPEDS